MLRQRKPVDVRQVEIEEQRIDLEVAPGVMMERRLFLRSSSLAAAALALPFRARASAFGARMMGQEQAASDARAVPSTTEAGPLGWEEFLKQAVPVAQQILKESRVDTDYYLYQVASMAARLSAVPDTKLYPMGKLTPPISLAPSYKGPPFAIIQWRMAPGAVFPPHNHPNYSVCTLGLEGEAQIRNYEIVGVAPEFSSQKSFRVRQTHDEFIAKGRINTLSPTRDNIHRFRAGREGARGIDITTLHGNDVGFSFIDIADKAVDPDASVYEASWKGMDL